MSKHGRCKAQKYEQTRGITTSLHGSIKLPANLAFDCYSFGATNYPKNSWILKVAVKQLKIKGIQEASDALRRESTHTSLKPEVAHAPLKQHEDQNLGL